MGKYIWPRNLAKASLWYLALLKEIGRGVTLDELLSAIQTDQLGKSLPPRRKLQRSLYYFTEQKLVKKSGSYKTARYQLTDTGLERLEKLSFRNKPVQTSKPWDGNWRLVLFDIPEAKSESRFHIRRLLKELGFRQLQLSAWIHPLPLLEHFKEIRQAYGVENDLLLLEVVNFTPPAVILKYFINVDPKIQKLYQNTHDRE